MVVNVDVEEKSTGNFSVAGGYSTSDGWLAEVSVSESNLLGRGQFARAAVQYGQRARGIDLSFAEPYFLGYRLGAGIDLFIKQTLASQYLSYDTKTVGVNLKLAFALSEEISLQPRYSIYRQEITLPSNLNNCNNITPNSANGTYPTNVAGLNPATGLPWVDPATGLPFAQSCYADGEASLAARRELAQGPVLTSLVGYTLAYNTLDNNKNPTAGLYAELRQDLAGVGGNVNFIRTTFDARQYAEVMPDIIGVVRLQGGHIAGWGSKELRMLDHFQMGSNLVRGFQPAGIGPRDLTCYTVTGPNCDPLGGSLYFGASAEVQTPLYFLPKEVGIKVAVFADAGSVWSYKGPKSWDVTGEVMNCPGVDAKIPCVGDTAAMRSSVGVGILWDSPLGPIRFDFAYPITKQFYDRTQFFRFSGGASF